MTQSAAEIAAMLGLAEDDPIVVEHIEAHEIEVREQRARDRVARTLGDHLQAGPKDPFANMEAGYAPRGDAARRLGPHAGPPAATHVGRAPAPKPAPQTKPAAKKKPAARLEAPSNDDASPPPKKPAAKKKKKKKKKTKTLAAPPPKKRSSSAVAAPPTGGDSSSEDDAAPAPPTKRPKEAKADNTYDEEDDDSFQEPPPVLAALAEEATDRWNCFAQELPKMRMTTLKKMLATLKPLNRDAYKAAMAARENKSEEAARKVVRDLSEHVPRGAIFDAYENATT